MKRTYFYQESQNEGKYSPVYIYQIGTQRAAPDINCNWHREVEFIYVRRGSLTLCINEVPYHLESGDVGIVNRNHLHYGITPENVTYDYLVVLFLLEDLVSITDHNERHLKDLADDALWFPPVIPSGHVLASPLIRILSQLEACSASLCNPAYDLKIKSLLMELLFLFASHDGELIREIGWDNAKANGKKETLMAIARYMGEHYTERISIASLASHLHMSHEALYKFTTQTMGCSPVEYINRYRLSKALDLLDSTNLSVTDICFQTGFHNVSYFIRRFQKSYGVTPKQYIKRRTEPNRP